MTFHLCPASFPVQIRPIRLIFPLCGNFPDRRPLNGFKRLPNAFKRGITGKEKRNQTEGAKRPGFATRPASFSAQFLFFMPASRTQPGRINRSCFKSRLVIMAVPHPVKHRFQLPAALRRLPPRSQAAPVWLRRRS